MPSLFLGKIGNEDNIFEIHALTKNLPFREYKKSEISDVDLFNKIIEDRFKSLETGHPIFCTAINPDINKKTELNPHDLREGTVHIIAVNKFGNISMALSIAVDIGLKDKGDIIGLPLENRWQQNSYPKGASLDNFRDKYVKLNYNNDRIVKPWEMAELYRHFKNTKEKDNLSCRLGVYTGCYHLMVREPRKKGLTPTFYWLFDAIPAYFNLYRYAGAAVLRDLTISNPIQYLSPNKIKISKKNIDGQIELFYNDKMISRNVKIPFPHKENGLLSFKYKYIPFLDGIVDISKCEKAIQYSPILLYLNSIKGFNFGDRIKLRFGLGIIGKRVWDEDYHSKNIFSNILNNYILKKTGSTNWLFNSVGSNKKTV